MNISYYIDQMNHFFLKTYSTWWNGYEITIDPAYDKEHDYKITYIDEFDIEHIIFITQEKFKNFQKILYKNLKKFKYSFIGYKGEDLSQFRMTISKQFDFDNSIFPLVNYQLEYFGGINETPKSYSKIIKELENLIGITL